MRGETPSRHVISPAPILTQYLSVYFSLSAEVQPNVFPTEGPSDMESAGMQSSSLSSTASAEMPVQLALPRLAATLVAWLIRAPKGASMAPDFRLWSEPNNTILGPRQGPTEDLHYELRCGYLLPGS